MKKFPGKIPVSVIIFGSLTVLLLILGLYTRATNNGIKEEDYPELTVIESGITSPENDGKTIFATGTQTVTENPVDTLTGMTADGIMLYREVSMYQYVTDGDSVYKEFRSKQMADVHGQGDEFPNPVFPDELGNACFFGKVSLSGGNLMLSENCILTVADNYGEYTPIEAKGTFDSKYKITDGICYKGNDPENPELGDVKITYYAIPAESVKELTLIGSQDDMTFCKAGDESSSAVLDETITPDEYYKRYADNPESTSLAYYVLAVICLIVTLILIIVNYCKTGKKKKKKRNAKHYAFIALMLGLMLTLHGIMFISSADFGDYGGDSDYGDYGGYDSGGYDYGGYDSGGYDNDHETRTTTRETLYYYFMYPVDDPYDGESLYFTSKGETQELEKLLTTVQPGDTNSDEKLGITGIVGIIDAVFLGIRKKKNKYTPSKPSGPIEGAQATDMNMLNPLSRYYSEDPDFDIDKFKAKLAKMYADLQGGWQNKDIAPVRAYMTDAFFAQMDRQLDKYRRNKQTNIVSDIRVTNVDVKGWYTAGGNDVMVAEVFASIKDYVIDDITGDVVKGSKDKTKLMRYEWSLVRPCGTKSGGEMTHTEVCPNCGAPIDINNAGKCAYCGSIIETKASDWALSAIKGLAQKTVG